MSPITLIYGLATALFIIGLKMMGRTADARRGNLCSALGMGLAVMATLFESGLDYKLILLGILIGSAIGLWSAVKVQMTEMPEMVALFNGSGGLASLLLGWAGYEAAPSMAQHGFGGKQLDFGVTGRIFIRVIL